jgi:hypothetical protein
MGANDASTNRWFSFVYRAVLLTEASYMYQIHAATECVLDIQCHEEITKYSPLRGRLHSWKFPEGRTIRRA